MDDQTKNLIQSHIDANEICLFMKGTPDAPQCGFSMAVTNMLKLLEVNFQSVNVLEDQNIREGIKTFSDWPTIPQLYIKSAHDVSIGGIITAVSKMCIKGNKGIDLKKPKYLINEIEYYFAEDQGRYIIEVDKGSIKKVTDILNKNTIHFDEIGTINEDQLFINEKTKVTIDELRTSNTNWLKDYMSK